MESHVWSLISAAESLCGLSTHPNPTESRPQVSRPQVSRPQIRTQEQQNHSEHLQQTLPSPSSSTSRPNWSQQNLRPSSGPEEEPAAFILDSRNFPDSANAHSGSHNPNIQVTIEVMEDSQPETQVEMDLAKENQRNDWSVSSSEWISSHRKSFWPLFWEYSERPKDRSGGTGSEDDPEDDPEDSVLTGQAADGGKQWDKDWETKDTFDYEEWSDWAPCSATCGSGAQKRTRSCGFGCAATESRSCESQSCSNATVDETSPPQSSGTDSGLDSCETWSSCRNDFLQTYSHQSLTKSPACPCSYSPELVYGAIHIQDSRLGRTYRWRDASGPKERSDIYKPSARFCMRSMSSYDSATSGAQHCCYDGRMRSITRGKGAGTPDSISGDFSPESHHKVDVSPWISCKGDWSRFHSVRPPNNGSACAENPEEPAFQTESREAQEY